MTQVMVDLETMGKLPGCAIISIGAVKFSIAGICDSFYRNVSLQSCVECGLKIEADTVTWWLGQGKEAREALSVDPVSIEEALDEFSDWIGGDMPVWGNGAAFDNPILNMAFEKTGVKRPWSFWNDRCYRTIKTMCPNVVAKRVGTYHNAVDDATTQALHLIDILKTLPEDNGIT